MPEFKLEALKHVKGRPIPQSIPSKNEYCEKVKMPDWFTAREAEPKDNNPYSPPGGNMFLSTYNRLGNSPDTGNFVTTTKLMLEQVKLKETLNFTLAKRPLVSYEELKKTCTSVKNMNCPEFCAPDFISTMKDTYQPPYPCVMKPLVAPKIPFLQNRKLKQETPDMCDDKFYDDSFTVNVKHLQDIKSARWISYNPMTRTYSDGTPVTTAQRKCYQLPYAQQ